MPVIIFPLWLNQAKVPRNTWKAVCKRENYSKKRVPVRNHIFMLIVKLHTVKYKGKNCMYCHLKLKVSTFISEGTFPLWNWGETAYPLIYLNLILAILQFEISSLMTFIFSLSKLDFYRQTETGQTRKKNAVNQTWYIKLENCKNKVSK